MAKIFGAPDVDWYKPRLNGAMYFIIGAFFLLLVRLFYLQLMEGEDLRRLSKHNSIRLQSLNSPRGLIFDSSGKVLVDNRPAFDLSIIPRDAKPIRHTVQNLARFLDVSVSELKAKVDRKNGISSYQPVLLKHDIGRNALAAIEVHKLDLPGVVIDVKPQRDYLYQTSAAHLIGYLSEVSSNELKSRKYLNYKAGDLIGKFGIEKIYEQFLRGTRGGRQVEVNVTGQIVRVLNTVNPEQGNSVYLSIDYRLQAKAEELLKGKAGAIVALDPRNGEVLALASSPTFDQNAFVNGMSRAEWKALIGNPLRPMENKAVQGEYPPASTYKIITAMAGLETGITDTKQTVFCPGSYAFGDRVFRCWKEEGHGTVNIIKALSESCDVYFYQLGHKLGVDRIAKYARAAGLGKATGINLDQEASGLVPTAEWKRRRFGVAWQQGETLSVAIGQGYNLTTPLQMAVVMAAVANGGTLWRPLILKEIETSEGKLLFKNKPEISGQLLVSRKNLEIVRRGLWEVVNHARGTARRIRIKGLDISGKTGTAQLFGRKDDKTEKDIHISSHLIPHAWFVAYAPSETPRIALAVIVEHGDSGSRTAAPIAGELIRHYLVKDKQPVPNQDQARTIAGRDDHV